MKRLADQTQVPQHVAVKTDELYAKESNLIKLYEYLANLLKNVELTEQNRLCLQSENYSDTELADL